MWGYTTLITQLPSYLDEVLHFNLQNSALLSSLPYMVYTVLVFIAGFLADWIFKRKLLSVTQIRKYFNNISFLCQMAFLSVAAFSSDKTIIIVCIVLSVGLGAFSSCGYTANVLDIAPQFSSLIFGISCTIATLPGMVSPPLSGYIAKTPVRPTKLLVLWFIDAIFEYFLECQRISNNILDSMWNLPFWCCLLWNFRIWRDSILGLNRFNKKAWSLFIIKLTIKCPEVFAVSLFI